MKKIIRFLSIMLAASLLAGCGENAGNKKTTEFDSLQVQEAGDSIVSEGSVQLHAVKATLLTVEAAGDFSGTFSITYTKDKGTLNITQGDKEILSLEKDATDTITSDAIDVDLQKGRNDFIISGEDCKFDFTVTFNTPDKSKVVSFGGGSLK